MRIAIAVVLLMSSLAFAQSGVAVVELFTSEGCSSCPPADELLKQIHDHAQQNGEPVYALAFHVDYWNRLGWIDRFSSPAFTQRQNEYAQRLHLDSIYTPQMIVNGTSEFVGSDKRQATAAIAAARQQTAAAKITATASTVSPDKLHVEFSCTGAGATDAINISLVEDDLASSVTRGENAGRALHHASVVRCFTSCDPSTHSLDLDSAGVNLANASVVFFVQDKTSGVIRGATAVKFP